MKELLLNEETNSPEETERLGKALAKKITQSQGLPTFVALYGDLGVGKTAFVRGFTSQIAPGAIVRSPTFALVHEYRGTPLSVFHFDMYRIQDEDDLYSIGFYDYQNRPGIILCEWSENIPFALPERYIRVKIQKKYPQHPNARLIEAFLTDEAASSCDGKEHS